MHSIYQPIMHYQSMVDGALIFRDIVLGQRRLEALGGLEMKSLRDGALAAVSVSQKTVALLAQAYEAKGRQAMLANVQPEVLRDLQQAAITQGTEASNAIEGDTVKPERVLEVTQRGAKPETHSEKIVAGYCLALEWIHDKHVALDLTPETIKTLHQKLYAYTDEPGGSYRTMHAEIVRRGGEDDGKVVFTPSPHGQVPRQMEDLCKWYRQLSTNLEIDPFILMAATILDFTCIHPFSDGNGRISRLLNTLLSYKAGFELVRYVAIEREIYATKAAYYWALTESSRDWHRGGHRWGFWLEYLAEVYATAYRRLFEQVEAKSVPGYKSEAVRNAVSNAGSRFTRSQILEALPSVSYQTVDKVLRELLDEGTLRKVGRGPATQYQLISAIDRS